MSLDLILPPLPVTGRPIYRPCPRCTRGTDLCAGKVLYPNSKKFDDRTVLICWHCNAFKTRGEPWQAIDTALHERQWRAANRRNANEDRMAR